MSEELPSINDFIEDKQNLPSVELFTEQVLPIQKPVIENKTEDKITQVIREQPDNTGLIVSLIESVRNSIPEVKSYDKELFEIVSLIEQLKNDIEDSKTEKTTLMESNGYDKDALREELNDIRNSIPQIPQMPEVRYYDEEIKQLQEAVKKDVDHTSEIKHLQESIHDVKNRSNVDHSWISSTFSSIDENYTTLSSSLATFKGKLEMDVQNIVESIETVSFEDKIDKKNLHERVDETHNLLEEQKAGILEKLQETSLNIWNLQKECKDDDSKLQSQINEQYVYLKEGIAAVIEDGDKRYGEVSDQYKEFDVYFKELKEQVEALPAPKYYEKDIARVSVSVQTVRNLVEELEKRLDNKLVELEEGLLNIPPSVDNSDPLTPLDQLNTTVQSLSKSYRLFSNRVQEQLATLGGGGAVWLWDLDDVNIGIPDNSTYPVIADNSPLVFDSATEQWVPGIPAGAGGTTFLPLAGGTMTGDINFNGGQQFPGTLELSGGTMTGEIGFTTAQTFPGALATTGGTMIGDIGFSTTQTFPGVLETSGGTMSGTIGFTSAQTFPGTLELSGGTMTGNIGFTTTQILPGAGGSITGDTTYFGDTSQPLNVQTRTSVNQLIATQVSGGFNFIGTTNVATDNPGAGVTGGDFYINTAVGIASTTWNGIAGLTISADQLVIYSANDTRWFAGAVENNTSYVQKSGSTMTGKLAIEVNRQSAASNSFVLNGRITDSGSDTADLLRTYIRGTGSDLPDYVQYFGGTTGDNTIQTLGSVNTLLDNYIPSSGGTMVGPLTLEADAFFTKKRDGQGNKDFIIEGTTVTSLGDTEAQLFFVNRNGVNANPDAINYDGLTTNDENIQNKKSVDALITTATQPLLPKSGGTMTGTLYTKNVEVATANTLTIKRGNSNTSIGGLDIKGYAYNDFQVQTDIFAVQYGNGSTVGDSINYKGKTDGPNNIQNKASVDAAISAAISADGNLLRGGSIRSTGGTADNSGTLNIFQTSLEGSGELNIFNSSSEPQVKVMPGFGISMGNGVFDTNAKTIYFNTSSSSGAYFQVNNSGKFHWKDLANDFMTVNAAKFQVFSPFSADGSSFTVNRGVASSSNTTNFNIKGMLSGGASTDSTLISIKRSSGQGDTFQYFGLTNTNDNAVQTKGSTKALIQSDAITPGTATYQNQASNTGSTLTGFFLADYSVNSDGMVHLLCSMQDGNNMIVGDVLCTLPVGYRPASAGSGMGYNPVFTAVNDTNNPTITSQWMVKTNGDITCISVSGGSTKFYGQCIFSAFDPG